MLVVGLIMGRGKGGGEGARGLDLKMYLIQG